MKSLDYFLGSLEVQHVNGDIRDLSVQAYAVDKPCGDDGIKLKDQFEMGQFHSCDYIIAKKDKDKVLLIEDSNLGKGKKDLEKKYLPFMRQSSKARKKLSEKVVEKIRDENRLKAYASLLLLCRLISEDSGAKKLIAGKKIHFWVIVTDGVSSDFHAFESIGSKLGRCLRPLVSDVAFLPLKEAEQKLSSEWA